VLPLFPVTTSQCTPVSPVLFPFPPLPQLSSAPQCLALQCPWFWCPYNSQSLLMFVLM
jgi:hypothetical protein